MHWEDERYVRLYTRDTLTWTRLGWQGQTVFSLLIRKVDRAGVIEIEDEEPAVALSGITGIPIEICDVAWLRLSSGKRPTVTIRDGSSRALVVPNFIEAQEARQSEKARARKSRELRRLLTPRDEESRDVTEGNDRSHGVTPSCAVPSRAQEEETHLAGAREAGQPKPQPAPADPWPKGMLEELMPVLGFKSGLEREWGDFIVESLKHPSPRRIAAAKKFIASGKRPDKPVAYLLTMIRDGVSEPEPSSRRKPYQPLTGTAERFKGLDDGDPLGLNLEPKAKEPPRG